MWIIKADCDCSIYDYSSDNEVTPEIANGDRSRGGASVQPGSADGGAWKTHTTHFCSLKLAAEGFCSTTEATLERHPGEKPELFHLPETVESEGGWGGDSQLSQSAV